MCTHGQQVCIAGVCGGGVSDGEVVSEVAQYNGLAHLKSNLCREGREGRKGARVRMGIVLLLSLVSQANILGEEGGKSLVINYYKHRKMECSLAH